MSCHYVKLHYSGLGYCPTPNTSSTTIIEPGVSRIVSKHRDSQLTFSERVKQQIIHYYNPSNICLNPFQIIYIHYSLFSPLLMGSAGFNSIKILTKPCAVKTLVFFPSPSKILSCKLHQLPPPQHY